MNAATERAAATGRFTIRSLDDVACAVEAVRAIAAGHGFGEGVACLLATVASELATNIVRYAGEGRLALRRLWEPERCGLAFLARDSGPGIPDVGRALTPGYSTGGGLGLGLPAVARAMDELAIESGPGTGTRVFAVRWGPAEGPGVHEPPCGLWLRPLLDAPRCGDTLLVGQEGDRWLIGVIDVLGHGAEAHELARTILEWLRAAEWTDPTALLVDLDRAIKGSRGAAVGLSILDAGQGRLRHAGIGNTVTLIAGRDVQEFPERGGVVGGLMPPPKTFCAPAAAGDLIIAFTDGLRARAVRDLLARLRRHPVGAIARGIGEGAVCGTDDASCLALRVP